MEQSEQAWNFSKSRALAASIVRAMHCAPTGYRSVIVKRVCHGIWQKSWITRSGAQKEWEVNYYAEFRAALLDVALLAGQSMREGKSRIFLTHCSPRWGVVGLSEGGGPLERTYFFGMYGKFRMQRCDVEHVSNMGVTGVSGVRASGVLLCVVRHKSIFR